MKIAYVLNGLYHFRAWATARGSYPADIDHFAPRQPRDLMSGQISAWSPALRRLVAATDPATVSTGRAARPGAGQACISRVTLKYVQHVGL